MLLLWFLKFFLLPCYARFLCLKLRSFIWLHLFVQLVWTWKQNISSILWHSYILIPAWPILTKFWHLICRSCLNYVSMGQCKKDVTPLLTHWSYVYFALTRRYNANGSWDFHLASSTSLLSLQENLSSCLLPTRKWLHKWYQLIEHGMAGCFPHILVASSCSCHSCAFLCPRYSILVWGCGVFSACVDRGVAGGDRGYADTRQVVQRDGGWHGQGGGSAVDDRSRKPYPSSAGLLGNGRHLLL